MKILGRLEYKILSKPPIFFSVFLLIGLAMVQGLFGIFQEIESKKASEVVAALLRQEESIINPQRLSQNLLDLKFQRAITCIFIQRADSTPFLNSSEDTNCNRPAWSLDGVTRTYQLKGVDGYNWTIRFRTVNHSLFVFSLWLARILVALLIFVGYLYISFRNRLFSQAIKAENEKAQIATDVASRLAHDIRSPLSALNIATQNIHGLSDDRRQMIQSAIIRINDVANSLLRRATTRANFDSELQGFEIEKFLNELYISKSTEYSEIPHAKIRLELPNEPLGSVNAQQQNLMRSLSNLINNSIEAFDGKPGEVIISGRKYANEVQISIQDNGKGIPADVMSKIGQRGFSYGKEDGSNSGSGLGLYFSKNVIESMGGKLEIVSKQGLGTIVSILLPRRQETVS